LWWNTTCFIVYLLFLQLRSKLVINFSRRRRGRKYLFSGIIIHLQNLILYSKYTHSYTVYTILYSKYTHSYTVYTILYSKYTHSYTLPSTGSKLTSAVKTMTVIYTMLIAFCNLLVYTTSYIIILHTFYIADLFTYKRGSYIYR